MTTTQRPSPESEAPETPNPETQAAPSEPAEDMAASASDPLAEALQREAELKDRLLRSAAELENVRRRSEKEKQDALVYASQRFAGALLPVLDTFQRALAHLSEDARAELPEPVRNLVAGIELTEKELLRIFEQHGIKPVNPKGEKFDPHLHQAIAQVPAPDVPEGHVTDVAQIGYTIGERLLRPAMVVVSTGGGAPVSVDTTA